MESVDRVKAIYMKEYNTHKKAIKSLVRLMDIAGKKFNTTHFRAANVFMIQLTHSAISTS